jgi:hypothetical protein
MSKSTTWTEMDIELLAFPQRVIASARIGIRPDRDSVLDALARIERASVKFANSGDAYRLDGARSVLTMLKLGHMPHREDCISAVIILGDLMRECSAAEQA